LIAVKLPLKSSDGKDWILDPTITNESVSQHLGRVVEGTSVAIGEKGEELGEWCDVDKVKKVYKLGGDGGTNKGNKGETVNGQASDKAHERRMMESVILGTIALKGS
jgi:EKC/KEOPS complex subunit CGI121/TPRKB